MANLLRKPVSLSQLRSSPGNAHPVPARLVHVQFKTTPRDTTPQEEKTAEGGADNIFKRSVDTILHRAASNLKRGPCTCLTCRGGGNVECAQCKGAGVLGDVAAERSDAVRSAFRQLRLAVGLSHEVPYASSEYMRTNRCPRCRGHGTLVCELCTGSGLRYPHQAKDQK